MATPLHHDLELAYDFFLQQVKSRPKDFAVARGLISSPSFFSIEKLQQLLTNPLLSPDWIFLKRQGNPIPLEQHYLFKQVHSHTLHFLDKKFINQELRNGAALVLEGIDIMVPEINAFAAKLDDAMPCSLANSVAFFSQSGTEAYEGHVDVDDVLVIHLSGEKTWEIFAPQPRRYAGIDLLSREQMGPKIDELVMHPGDVLYLRAGVPHLCHTTADHSLHLAFDLVDNTPNPKQVSEEVNRIYEFESADAYVPAAKAMQQYVKILTSPEFQESLKAGTQSVKEGARNFRRTIGQASEVDALTKYLKPGLRPG